MRPILFIFTLSLLVLACSKVEKITYLKQIENLRLLKDLEFKSANSPLSSDKKAVFSQLSYFEVDTSYVFTGKVEWLTLAPPVKLHIDTGIDQEYYRSVKISFLKNDTLCYLTGFTTSPLISNHIFIPFKDQTTAKTSYGAGRFIDIEYERGDSVKIDFNLAYNPYCAYNEKYNCPVPPVENNLEVCIFAGEKYSLVENH